MIALFRPAMNCYCLITIVYYQSLGTLPAVPEICQEEPEAWPLVGPSSVRLVNGRFWKKMSGRIPGVEVRPSFDNLVVIRWKSAMLKMMVFRIDFACCKIGLQTRFSHG